MDKLGKLRNRERILLGAGAVPLDVRRERDQEAIQRGAQFLAEQESRPLADTVLLQEVAELNDEKDGRFLTQQLARLADEVRVLLIRGSSRELALTLTSIEQAEHWATQHGIKTGSHTVIDRRIFQTTHQEAAQ